MFTAASCFVQPRKLLKFDSEDWKILSGLIAEVLVRRVARALGMHFEEWPLTAETIGAILQASTSGILLVTQGAHEPAEVHREAHGSDQ